MITCQKCGRRTPEGAFCEKCGEPLSDPLPRAAPRPGVPDRGIPTPENAARDPAVRFDMRSEPLSGMPNGYNDAPTVRAMRMQSPFRAGEPLGSGPSRDARSEPLSGGGKGSGPVLMIDKLCVQFDGYVGMFRFRFDPRDPGEGLQDIRLRFESQLTGERVEVRPIRHLDRQREIPVSFPVQSAGAVVWFVTVEYEKRGRRHVLEGSVQMVVVHPREAQTVAGNLAINITNNISNGNASDVHISQRAADDLAKLSGAENPFDELRRIVAGPARAWEAVELFDADEVESFPPMPSRAVTDRITLDFGVRKVVFFAGRTVTFGRKRELNDIVLRPPADAGEEEQLPYRSVSRAHCYFEHQGDSVAVCDGQRNEYRVVKPSSGGTFWNDQRISGQVTLSAGTSGVLSFAGPGCSGALSMQVKACPSASACESCPYANKHWCGEGARPSLVLARRDGIPELFVAVWSCFSLAEADPSFSGVVIFRKDGGFAWRKGRRCGWIVPGTEQQTDFGVVKVS